MGEANRRKELGLPPKTIKRNKVTRRAVNPLDDLESQAFMAIALGLSLVGKYRPKFY